MACKETATEYTDEQLSAVPTEANIKYRNLSTESIVIDGNFDDWGGVKLTISDLENDSLGDSSTELKRVLMAKTATSLVIKAELVGAYQTTNLGYKYSFILSFKSDRRCWVPIGVAKDILIQTSAAGLQSSDTFANLSNLLELSVNLNIIPSGAKKITIGYKIYKDGVEMDALNNYDNYCIRI
jgi:hypothetical protein